MAIRALNSVIVANYDTAANASWHAGACLARDTSNPGRVVTASRDTGLITGGFVGFSADDTARTDNTMILADPVGSNYIDGSGVFQTNNNGFYVAAKRAIGDFQAENVNGVTNLSAQSSGYEGPRRGVGVFNTPGGQFVTDQFLTTATSSTTADGGTATYLPGAYLTVALVANTGKVLELANKTHGPVVGIVDKYDSAAGLLYFTQAYFERAI
jgi:hypothetical protein